MNILDSFSMIWSVYWSIRPGGRAFDCLLCLIVHYRHVTSAEHMLYAARTRYSQFLVASTMFLMLSVQQSASHRMFLGALTKLRKASIRFITSASPSDRKEQLVSHWTDFIKFDFEYFFFKSARKIQISLKSDKKSEYFTWRPIYIYMYDHFSLIPS